MLPLRGRGSRVRDESGTLTVTIWNQNKFFPLFLSFSFHFLRFGTCSRCNWFDLRGIYHHAKITTRGCCHHIELKSFIFVVWWIAF
ncbi:hypothetical protein I3842_08G124700 [Carya illinoinensis]|uniref:Uncharacterized protein n=1 Tax=Carya illinoinensis TaxID=32201 RepID=A0A922JC90_CARIL|nr:hypothetical protein I3842_08G124700 [Carya illinoinensis]